MRNNFGLKLQNSPKLPRIHFLKQFSVFTGRSITLLSVLIFYSHLHHLYLHYLCIHHLQYIYYYTITLSKLILVGLFTILFSIMDKLHVNIQVTAQKCYILVSFCEALNYAKVFSYFSATTNGKTIEITYNTAD